ncbi:PREDICTED: uncharacterized protein LOC101296373 [Fragaria vesca subsp. vesca]|uniref:uncharacterized protein LOC101296373 n=1 Tax=Fragaria vesca subsp. vesca TaxID=101020 RepID=UPI0002C2F26F|nr:PREDICTED: uncharacterized protein LOC101296373 [Fragaria vesca subsp. vesca]
MLFNHSSVIAAAASVGSAYREINNPGSSAPSVEAVCIKWIPPATNWVKLNFDGSVSDASAAAGYILRNSNGNPLVAGARRLYSSNVPVSECLALKDGLLAAKLFNHKILLVEGDSLVINSLRDPANAPWKIKPILCDILHLAHWFENISFTHIFREANFMTDVFANTGHALQCPKIWVGSYRPQAFSAFQLDSSQTGCPRGFSL